MVTTYWVGLSLRRVEVTRLVPEVKVEYCTPLCTEGYALIFFVALPCSLTRGAMVNYMNGIFLYLNVS